MIKRIVIIIIAILVPVLGRGLYFYSGFYSASPIELPSYTNIAVSMAPSTEYSDVYEQGEGTVLVDIAHDNDFEIEELNVLAARLVSRGLTIEFLSEKDDLEKELLGKENEKEDNQGKNNQEKNDQEKEAVDAFIVVCPLDEFSNEERETIDSFIDNGGRLLLIADPTRTSKMNSLSLEFGLIFEPDYLYNQKENESNYRNIFVTEFEGNEITKDLTRIALYTAGSITSADGGIAFGDENTLSSLIETRTRLSPIALAQESKVLAIHDLTFITEPHNGILDNNQLISNIAGWLATPAEEEPEEEEEEDEEEPEEEEEKEEVEEKEAPESEQSASP